MLWYRSCPRCESGTMYLDEDNAKHCMQCGFQQHQQVVADMSPDIAEMFNLDELLGETAERELVSV